MFAIATPAKQTAEDTIVTLASRLSSATLLEDRRAAVLGLKSFSSSYPATVSSNALRGLLGCLDRDRQDVETSLATLQTLLQLFNPSDNSPEASEEIALWIADEFTQQQDFITLLINFLDIHDFHSKLCSLKLLTAILLSRTERTKELICSAPLGISKLVATLDDSREIIRNEGLSLLIYLTPDSIELQKSIAFEDAFDRIFNIIKTEGSLLHGDGTVEDCMILLANLLRLNESNQTFFRETGFVSKVAWLLADAIKEQDEEPELAEWARIQRNRNIYALLAVLRLFLVTGNTSLQTNQVSFWQSGVLSQALKLAFSPSGEIQIKSEALITCADIIRGNSKLQEEFGQLQVASFPQELQKENSKHQNKSTQVYVIDGLLDVTLNNSSLKAFDIRIAASECIKAYLHDHSIIRQHFLRRAIEGYMKGEDVTPNFLTILLQPLGAQAIADPYRLWFAAVIFLNLIFGDPNVKSLATSIREGDAANGEEEITCVQSLTGRLLDAVKNNADERILTGYLMLLCGWLFEDLDSVNDFLGEASHLQSIVQVVLNTAVNSLISQGLCALLLGILYEFSTKDSPVPRSTIHQVLFSQLSKDKYIDRLLKLRRSSLIRDFEVLPQKLSLAPAGGLPEVFFEKIFVEFIKDNFSRLLRSLDRDPEYEVSIFTNGAQRGISREMVDSLQSQLEERDLLLEKYKKEIKILGNKHEQELINHQRTKMDAEVELNRIKQINESLKEHQSKIASNLNQEHNQIIQDYKRQLEHLANTTKKDLEQTQAAMETKIYSLQNNIDTLKMELKRSESNFKDLQNAYDILKLNDQKNSVLIETLEKNFQDLEIKYNASIKKISNLEISLVEKENEKNVIQAELEDLLIVFTDVEDKIKKYKCKLQDLGETVSDAEDEGDNTE
ncbi:Intracellular protein transport protein USO1 [Erysiphe neolycopersici]|uniref:Intracellular protein transport protein USO1 n=1 Tax=Erysiphe neolycopersici TaxID=212602 RepID=A0A420HDA7_9PEZI|nr:Intracellular protein transport protein USO1 [Erysiphe neolycopersici]